MRCPGPKSGSGQPGRRRLPSGHMYASGHVGRSSIRGDQLMLAFDRVSADINDEVMFDVEHLVLGAWSARSEESVRGHIEELSHYGVPPPSSFPLFYRVSASLVSQTDRLEVLGPHTSGEIEYVIVAMEDGLWVTVGSDQTDRKAEAQGVALSKQLAGKVLGRTPWRLAELRAH